MRAVLGDFSITTTSGAAMTGRVVDGPEPTVVFEAGAGPGDAVATWEAVRTLLAREQRTVAYQRPTGPPKDLAAAVHDLRTVLDAVAADRPVLVGHSFGGLIVARLAADNPDAVGGLVLVDPTPPGCLPIVRRLLDELREVDEFDLNACAVQMRDLARPLVLGHTQVALIVPTRPEAWPASVPAWYRDEIDAHTLEWRATWRETSSRLTVVAADADHQIPRDDPAAIVRAIRSVCEAAGPRSRTTGSADA